MKQSEIKDNYKKLTKQEEMECVIRAKAGDRAASNKLIKSILPLIACHVRRLSNINNKFSDLFNEGVLGAYKSIQTFDLKANCRWSSYACQPRGFVFEYIRQAIHRDHVVGLSVKDRLEQNFNTFVSFNHVPEEQDHGLSLVEIIPDTNADDPSMSPIMTVSKADLADIINRHVTKTIDKQILHETAMGKSLRDISNSTGISHQTVINRKEKQIKKLRQLLAKELELA